MLSVLQVRIFFIGHHFMFFHYQHMFTISFYLQIATTLVSPPLSISLFSSLLFSKFHSRVWQSIWNKATFRSRLFLLGVKLDLTTRKFRKIFFLFLFCLFFAQLIIYFRQIYSRKIIDVKFHFVFSFKGNVEKIDSKEDGDYVSCSNHGNFCQRLGICYFFLLFCIIFCWFSK